MSITQEQLREHLQYEPETGLFYWIKPTAKSIQPGDLAGGKNERGYVRIWIEGKSYRAHRLAFLYMNGVMPYQVDHINLNPSDNRWVNLREADQSHNNMNRSKQRNNTTGFKGVTIHKRSGKFRAQIYTNGSYIHLGLHPTAEKAHKAYAKAAEKHHGQFARI